MKLYGHQIVDACFFVKSQCSLNSNLMGSGKTISVVVAARYIEERLTGSLPALVICPNSTKISWAREIEKWWPGTPVYIVEGTKAKRQKTILQCLETPGVVIINWESVRLFSRLAPYGSMALSEEERRPKELNQVPWRLVIADEAHRMSDPTSKQTRATWWVGENAQYKWALTGTPLTKTPDTLWPLLHFLDSTEWPAKTAYINRYCDSAPSRWGPGLDVFGLSEGTKEEFFEIFDPRFRRLPKEVILPNLPPIQKIARHIEMSPEQEQAYETMSEDLLAVDENGELIIASNPISKLTRLIQFSSASLTMVDGMARMAKPSCKIDQLITDLDDYLTAGESVVVFAVHRQLIEMAEERLSKKRIKYTTIKGGQSASLRQKMIDDFQSGKVQVILVVIAAGGVGVTLTAGRIAIFLQRPFSNVDYQQAMARIHRIGSEIHESILVVDYITRGTVEIGQLRILEGKARQLESIVRDREALRKMILGEENF